MENHDLQKNLKIVTAKTKKDCQDIADLARVIWTEHFTPIIGSEQVQYMLEKFQSSEVIYNLIKNEGYIYFMAIYEGAFVGYLAIMPNKENKEIFMSKIYILKDYRKRGIAKGLFNMLINTFKKDYKSIYLTVNKKNVNSIEVYKKIGFTIIESLVSDIGGGFIMDDYKMKMDIKE